MANLELLTEKVEEYVRRFRKESLDPICRSEAYDLKKDTRKQSEPGSSGWPDSWPQTDRRGIYAVFSQEKLLYIGKASQQPLGYRLSSYFRYGPDRHCVTAPGHKWSSEPTHIVTWAVPDKQFFEASALEEFLISELSDELPDNTAGKNA